MTTAFRTSTVVAFALGLSLATPIGLLGQRGGAAPADGGAARPGGTGQRGGGQGGRGGAGGVFRGRGALPAGTAVIRGRVTSDTGTPVRRAQVRAVAGGIPGGRLAATDAEGRFELRDLPAGQWSMTASKPGFVTQRFGQRRPFESVPPIDLSDGQRLDGANFSLERGGAINGRVLDDFGDPVANVRVQVHRSRMVEGRRRLSPVGGGDESDDTGAFRLYGLAPGDYYVSATLRTSPVESASDRSGYAPTYYPGTGNAAEAQRITLGAGEETTISFSLLPVRTIRISGTVLSAAGGTVANGAVVLASANDADEGGVVTATGGQIRGDGSFTIVNVAPGSYVLNARTGLGGRAGGGPEIGHLPITVGESDVTGVTIAMTRGASISGTVAGTGASRLALDSLRVTARPLQRSPLGQPGATARVSAAGVFQLTGLSGPTAIRVEGLPQEWVLESIAVGGLDATDTAIDLRGTEQVTNARIVVTDRVTEVNGGATLRGQTAGDFTVVVFADDEARWAFPSRYVRTSRADQQGRFSLRGLPPGARYLAVAVSYLEDGEAQDTEFLERLRDDASAFTLREGETKTLALRLVER